MQQNQPSFNPSNFKGPDSSSMGGLGGSPSTPQPSTPNSANGVGGSNTSGNQQDWTFEEQFKQVNTKKCRNFGPFWSKIWSIFSGKSNPKKIELNRKLWVNFLICIVVLNLLYKSYFPLLYFIYFDLSHFDHL